MRRLSFCVIALALGLAGCSTISGMMGGGERNDGMTSATSASTMDQPASAPSANCADQAQGTQPSGEAPAECPPASAEQPAPQPQ